MNRTIINDMVEQIKNELDHALLQVGTANDTAMTHIQRATKQIDSLRYHVWNTYHKSGEGHN